jgi:catechol 2,3-dioxygenase-like lactoylglutathione lyase family enzyme
MQGQGMTIILGIDHVQLAMPQAQEAAARQFYGQVLGMPEIPKPADLALRGGAWFQCGPLQIHLGVEPDFRPARKAHPAILVSDVNAFIARLRMAGVEVLDDVQIEGYQRIFAFDPFGNRLEFMQRLS